MRTGSPVNARFSGDAPREYRWFTLAATLPLVSTSAAAAARKIVRAVVAGETEIAITPQAVVAARLGNLAPELVSLVMGGVNRLLPSAVAGKPLAQRGAEIRNLERIPVATARDTAGQRYNQTA
jgi:hypothetical protein